MAMLSNDRNRGLRLLRFKVGGLRVRPPGDVILMPYNTFAGPEPDAVFGDLKVPGEIWVRLFKYQQVSVRWLWELHQQVSMAPIVTK